jgi:hypothetical protein
MIESPTPGSLKDTSMFASRRTVIKTVALCSAAMIFSPNVLLSATRSKKEKLGVALVGLGYYSEILAGALQQTKHCHLTGIVTGTPSKAEAWKKKYKIADKIFTIIKPLMPLPTTRTSMWCMWYYLHLCIASMWYELPMREKMYGARSRWL